MGEAAKITHFGSGLLGITCRRQRLPVGWQGLPAAEVSRVIMKRRSDWRSGRVRSEMGEKEACGKEKGERNGERRQKVKGRGERKDIVSGSVE